MKTADTSLLRVAYDEWNERGERTVLLLHGWPDSPRCWAGVAPRLAAAGWRVIAPALRGFAPTTFLREDTPRSGQLSALGRDLLEFIDALGLRRPALAGHDWGARAVANACGLRPGVASHLVLMSVGYGTNAPDQPMPLEQARRYWYHWYMATAHGERSLQGLQDLRAALPAGTALWAGGACAALHRRTPAGVLALRALQQVAPAVQAWRDGPGAASRPVPPRPARTTGRAGAGDVTRR